MVDEIEFGAVGSDSAEAPRRRLFLDESRLVARVNFMPPIGGVVANINAQGIKCQRRHAASRLDTFTRSIGDLEHQSSAKRQ